MIEVKKYIDLWDNDQPRRQAVAELLCIYDHDWDDLLKEKLKANFQPQNLNRMYSKLDTSLNLMRWSADTLSPIYCEGVSRSIEGNESADLSIYEADGILNLTLDRASRLLFAVREVLLRPILDEATNTITVDILTPDKCSVIRHPDNPLRLVGLVYQTKSGDYVVWDEDDHKVFDRSWREKRRDNGERYENDYNMIPFVLAHAAFPERGTWHEQDANGLKAATLNLGMAKTDYNHKRHLQSHKQLVFTGTGTKGIGKKANSDAGSAIVMKDQGSDAKVLDLQGDLGGHLDAIVNDAAQTLSLYGINPAAVRGNMDASSGYALSIKLTDTERVWKQQRVLWEAWERQLYEVSRRVVEVDGNGASLPDGKLLFEWPYIGPAQDKNQDADYWLKLLAAGVTSVPEVRRHLFDETPEQLQQWMEEKEAYAQETSPIAPPSMPAPLPVVESEPEPVEA